jgi:hypothetical protein
MRGYTQLTQEQRYQIYILKQTVLTTGHRPGFDEGHYLGWSFARFDMGHSVC